MKLKYFFLVVPLLIVGCGNSSSQNNTKPVIEDADMAIMNVNVIPMETDQILANYTVVIKDGKIIKVADSDSIEVAEGIQKIDGLGKYLIPGLAEMHAHIPGQNPSGNINLGDNYLENTLFLYLSNGVTTIRGMLGQPFHLELKEQVAKGEVLGPRIFTSGPSMNGNSVQSVGQAEKMVVDQKNAGYDFLKLHPGLKLEVFNAIDKTADSVGIPFAGHVSVDVGIRRALEAQYASIDHVDGYIEGLVPESADVNPDENGFFGINFTYLADESKIPELATMTKEQGVWVVPTQCLMERWVTSIPPEELAEDPGMKYIPPELLERYVAIKNNVISDTEYDAERADKFIELRRKIIKSLHDTGVGLLLGSDAPQVFNVPGFSIQHELQAMIDAGLTPYEALRIGTINPALFFGKEDEFGTIKEGASADMILLETNPLVEIGNVKDRLGVMVKGTWLSQEDISNRLEEIQSSYSELSTGSDD